LRRECLPVAQNGLCFTANQLHTASPRFRGGGDLRQKPYTAFLVPALILIPFSSARCWNGHWACKHLTKRFRSRGRIWPILVSKVSSEASLQGDWVEIHSIHDPGCQMRLWESEESPDEPKPEAQRDCKALGDKIAPVVQSCTLRGQMVLLEAGDSWLSLEGCVPPTNSGSFTGQPLPLTEGRPAVADLLRGSLQNLDNKRLNHGLNSRNFVQSSKFQVRQVTPSKPLLD